MNRFSDIPMRWKLVATMVVTTFVVVVLISAMMMNHTQQNTELAGLTTARALADQIVALRTFYTANVVRPARAAGIDVNYDFDTKQHTLPLPATMVKALGEEIAATYRGSRIRLYSRHPFPHRSDGETYDEFELEALERREEKPQTPVHRLEEIDGRQAMRYAVADIMRTPCVNCHNSHPESPKTDWKEGAAEVVVGMKAGRGVAEALDRLTGSIAETVELVGNGSSAAPQQAVASQEVLEQMSTVNSGAVETASGIEETKLTIQHVNTTAEAVKTMI